MAARPFSIYIFVGSVWWWWDGVCDVFAHDLVWGSLMSGCTLVSGIRGWGGWRGGGWGPRCAPTSLTTGAVGGGGGGGGREGTRYSKEATQHDSDITEVQ